MIDWSRSSSSRALRSEMFRRMAVWILWPRTIFSASVSWTGISAPDFERIGISMFLRSFPGPSPEA